MPSLQKITVEAAVRDGLRCSFCASEPAEGSDLVAGNHVYICDECIASCSDALAEETEPGGDDSADPAEPSEADPKGGDGELKPSFVRILTEADVARLVQTDELINVMEATLRRFSDGEAVQPVRTVMTVDGNNFFAVMPCYLRDPATLGAKLVAVFPGNRALGLPTHVATVLLLSPVNGALRAVVGGRHITAARTAAVSAVSADVLAKEDSAVLAIIGSGTQARSHVIALERIFELSEVRVWSPTPEHQIAFIEDMEAQTTARLVGADSAEEAVRAADIVVLVTSSSEPVVQSEWIKSGAHIICVGACRPDQREMDPALVQRGRLFVDSRAAALVESGDIVMGIKEGRFTAAHILGELGEVIGERVQGRRSPRDVTIFKSLGMAVEDVAMANMAYRRAVADNLGQELEL